MRLNTIVMAAGQGTRLMPLTKSIPKPLVDLSKTAEIKPVMHYILNQVRALYHHDVEGTCYLAISQRHETLFREFLQTQEIDYDLELIVERPDQVITHGFAGGLKKALDESVPYDEGVLVMAGDGISSLKLIDLVRLYQESQDTPVMAFYKLKSLMDASRNYGVAKIDETTMQIVEYEEKPEIPPYDLANITNYILRKQDVEKIGSIIAKANSGNIEIMEWIANDDPNTAIKAHVFGLSEKEFWFDIGSLEKYAEAVRYVHEHDI